MNIDPVTVGKAVGGLSDNNGRGVARVKNGSGDIVQIHQDPVDRVVDPTGGIVQNGWF